MKIKNILFNNSFRFLSNCNVKHIDRKMFDYFLYLAPHARARFSKEIKKSKAKEIYDQTLNLLNLNGDSFYEKYVNKISQQVNDNQKLEFKESELKNFKNLIKITNAKGDKNIKFKHVLNILIHIRNSIAHDNLYIKSLNKNRYVLLYDELPSDKKITALCCFTYENLIKFYKIVK